MLRKSTYVARICPPTHTLARVLGGRGRNLGWVKSNGTLQNIYRRFCRSVRGNKTVRKAQQLDVYALSLAEQDFHGLAEDPWLELARGSSPDRASLLACFTR